MLTDPSLCANEDWERYIYEKWLHSEIQLQLKMLQNLFSEKLMNE